MGFVQSLMGGGGGGSSKQDTAPKPQPVQLQPLPYPPPQQQPMIPQTAMPQPQNNGMLHFDQGGTIPSLGGQNTTPSTAGAGFSPNIGGTTANNWLNGSAFSNPGDTFSKMHQLPNPAQTDLPAIGHGLQNVAQDFTIQNAYQAGLAPTTQYNFGPGINAGFNQYGQTNQAIQGNIAAEQALQQQLRAQALGQGPNPAQAALNQATGANIASQGALMAGQRGASANTGLMARQIAQQGANTQQQSVGQAAALRAQQQLAAQQGLMGVQGQVGQQLAAQQGQANQLYSNAAYANAAQNAGLVNNYNMAQNINANVAAQNAAATQNTMSGLMGSIGSIASLFAKGGKVPEHHGMAFLKARNMKGGGHVPGKAKLAGDHYSNDTVPAMLSPGEIVVPRSAAKDPAKAAAFAHAVASRRK